MANIFNSVKVSRPTSNTFDLSHDVKLSFDMGELIPTACIDCLPGDKFNMSSEQMLRFASLISPVMHKVDVYAHWFFVPYRICWPGFQDFIEKPDVEKPAWPVFNNMTVGEGSLADYLGLPPSPNIDQVSAMPFAAYNRIYNEYYRDQNLSAEVNATLVDGENDHLDMVSLQKRAWEHDYFTASLPFAQSGEAVDIPLGDVQLKDNWASSPSDPTFRDSNGLSATGDIVQDLAAIKVGTSTPSAYDPAGTLQTEPVTVESLRRAMKIQEFLERLARGGRRLYEIIRSNFDVISSDARLQRPEYLGGSKSPMVISEVLQTAPPTDTANTPQGNMAGHGISVGSTGSIDYRCEEHGYLMCIMSVRPKTSYMQGIPKHFSKFNFYDLGWPSLAHLGEQEVKSREVYYSATDSPSLNDSTFGYIPRYAEYKYIDGRVAGDFRSSLSFWHLARNFDTRPGLNQTFIECNPARRIFAVLDEQQDTIYAHVFHRIKANRKLPMYGTPTF